MPDIKVILDKISRCSHLEDQLHMSEDSAELVLPMTDDLLTYGITPGEDSHSHVWSPWG